VALHDRKAGVLYLLQIDIKGQGGNEFDAGLKLTQTFQIVGVFQEILGQAFDTTSERDLKRPGIEGDTLQSDFCQIPLESLAAEWFLINACLLYTSDAADE